MFRIFMFCNCKRQLVLLLFALASFISSIGQNIFLSTSAPASPTANDGPALEIGVKFRVTLAGYITGIRFYKVSGNTGTHIGHLWSSTGTKLAEATFTGETASGWQQISFTTPVAVTTGTTYVASYFSSAGYYSSTNPYFTSTVVNGPLRALASGEDGGNGVYIYTATSAFPNNNFQSSNYWVDVVFSTTDDITPPTVTSVSPVNGAAGVAVNTTVSAVFNEDMSAVSISGSTIELRNPSNTLIAATVTYNAGTRTATLTPSAVLANSTVYTATIKGGASGVKDAAGNALANDYTLSFTTVAADVTLPTVTSVFPLNGAMGTATNTTVSAVFDEDMNAASISGSTIELRNPSNALITAAVIYNAGTRTATLTPSATLASSTVYTATIKGGASGVKDAAGNALVSDYSWSFTTDVDVTPPTVTSVLPLNGATGVAINTTVSAAFNEDMDAATISSSTVELRNPSNLLIETTVTYNAAARTATLTPAAALDNFTVYTATVKAGVSGVKDMAGNALASDYSWAFTTVAPDVTPPTITSVLPLNGATDVAVNTTVSSVFNEDMNAATISGSTVELRNPSNALITATITYNAGTKTATLTPTVALDYSAVYTATIKGGTGVKDVAGNALASDYTWSFTTAAAPDITPPTVTSVSPVNGTTGVSASTTVMANFSEAVNASTVTASTFQLKDAGNNIIAAAVSTASGQITLTPSSSLTLGTVYTATITGGSSGVKDLAGNPLASNYSWSFTTAAPVTFNIFSSASAPASPTANDGPSLELGVKFRVTQTGYITGIRFYKVSGNAGTHIGHLWSSTGTKLGEATFTGETASGWQQVLFTTPVAVATGTTYVASYFSSAGYYSSTNPYFTSAVVNGPLRALASGEDGGNGVYTYAAASAFPANNFQSSNYWVDLVFSTTDVTPPTVTSVLPLNGVTGVAINTTVSAVFNEDMTAATISGSTIELRNPSNTLIAATVTYNAGTKTATLTPSAVLANSTVYTATVKAGVSGVKDLAGNALASDFIWSFTTEVADVTPPAVTSVLPLNGATGVAINTTVSAVFNEDMNAATISGSTIELRNPSNVLITATVTYNAGTRTATLTPSAVLTNSTVYTAKVKSGASGVKDVAGNALASDFTWPFTTVAADVTPPTVASVSPLNGATGVSVSTTVIANFSEAVNASTVTASTFQLKDAGNNIVAASVSTASGQITLTPSSSLAFGTVYTATITGGSSGVKDLAGNALASNYSWSFTTASAASVTYNIFSSASAPASTTANDGPSLELGVKFRVTQAGYITGIRFYKVSGNTGTHIGHLWSSAGTKLGEATFSSETSSGWQQVLFTNPIAVTAGITYVASYFSSAGYYSNTNPYFTSAIVNGPLQALASGEDGGNGVYIYAATSAFPNNNFQSSNYWVDVVFSTAAGTDVTPPTVTSVLPVNGATGVAINTTVSAVFNEAMNTSTINSSTIELRNPSNALITATITYNATTNTAVLTPSAALANSIVYTAKIKSGTSGVKDAAGNALASDYTWSFTTAAVADVTPPTVTSVSPVNGTTGVNATTTVVANFNEAVNASTVTTSTFQLKDAGNNIIVAAVSTASGQITLTPSSSLALGAVYTATITGGSSGVKDLAGNALASNYSWSFTTAAPVTYNIFPSTSAPSSSTGNDGQAIELGVKFRVTQTGYITGIRFYKVSGNTGTHIGHLWSSAGTKLGEATFTGETASGWQQVLFTAPVAVTTGTTYVASYFSSAGHYSSTNPYFTSAVVNGPLRALANGEDGGNGLYKYTAASAFPNNNFQSSNYWVDVVFSSSGTDVTPPSVQSTTPANLATGAGVNTLVTASFNESINPSTVTASSFQLRNASNVLIPASVSATGSKATLSTSASLSFSTTYTATIKGGSSGVKDVAGNPLANDYSWTFTTSASAGIGPVPILVLYSSSNAFSQYASEILKAEGLNEFSSLAITSVNASVLNNYDVIVLGEMALTAAQVTMLTDWTNGGGTLIAFRPAAGLASLMGITSAGGTLDDKYLLVNTASGAGVGIVNQTIQFHGSADRYTLSGATSVATLYSDASTATAYPAVTTRTVGSNGKAIAFTYDLAKSIVYTRQGNPAWAAQERDGMAGIRSDDMFFGNKPDDVQPDWVDLNKVAIPQADEQQRLLTNIIIKSNLQRKPLPRLWFLPKGLKAAVVMTGDDHANGGTIGRFNQYMGLGPNTAQAVADWTAIRSTSYIYPGTPITNTEAMAFEASGFEIALHPFTGCTNNWTPASLQSDLTSQLGQLASQLPGISAPRTSRTHCVPWSDWSTQPQLESAKGIRLDVNYYYWPAAWVANKPGMFTGSGMPMRFADINGSIINCYQVPTQMTDESGISNYATFCNSLLDKALGVQGYYGVFCANMHTDLATIPGSDAIVASAIAHNVPVVSAKQMLDWLDGRNGTTFGTITMSGNQLSFSINALSTANNLKAMVPFYSDRGSLVSITRDGSGIAFTSETIKGIEYAFFDATSGNHNYVATYSGVALRRAATAVTTQPLITVAPHQSKKEESLQIQMLDARIAPNPSASFFNLTVMSNDKAPVSVRISDISGRIFERYEKVTSGSVLQVGQSLTSGVYFADVIQDNQRKVVKMIKVN